jgi:hypothetical protein
MEIGSMERNMYGKRRYRVRKMIASPVIVPQKVVGRVRVSLLNDYRLAPRSVSVRGHQGGGLVARA